MKRRYWFIINIFALLSICSYLFYNFYEAERAHKIAEVIIQQKIQAKLAAKSFAELFEKLNNELLYLSNQPNVISLNESGKDQLRKLQSILQHEIKSITRTNVKGIISFTTPYYPNSQGNDISKQKHMRKILADHKPVVSDVFTSVQGFQTIAIHYPVFKNGKYDGSIAFTIDFKEITNGILNEIKLGNTTSVWMLSREGIELYSPIPNHVGKSIYETVKNYPELLDLAKKMIAGREGIATYSYNKIFTSTKNVKKICYYITVRWNNTFWSIAISSSEEEITASLSDFARKLIIILAVIFIGVISISYFGLKAWFIIRESDARKKVENELRESEERYRTISTVASDYMFSSIINKDGKLVHSWVAGAFEKITGYTFDEYVNRGGWVACLHPDDFEKDKNDMELLKKNIPINSEIRTIHKNGETIWVHVYAHPIWSGDENRLIGINGAVNDITERKTAESELKKSQEKLQAAFENAPTGMSIISPDGQYIDVNPYVCKMLGYTKEELLSGKINNITHPDDIEPGNEWIKKIKSGDFNQPEFEKRFIHKNGSILWGVVRAKWLHDADGKLLFSVAHLMDITERKHAEDQLKTFQRATEQSPASIIITDTNGQIQYVNKMFSRNSGYSSEEIIGKSLRILNIDKNIKGDNQKLWSDLRSGIEWKGEYYNKKKDGTYYWESTLISPIKDKDDNITHLIVVQEDITERKEYEKKLTQAKERAEEVNKLKSNFLANMSHELRTPLMGMMGFSELLYNELEGDTKELVRMMNLSSKRLLNTLNTLLNYSKIEAEKMQINFNSVPLLDLIREEIKLFDVFAQQNGIELKENFLLPDIWILTDEKLLKEIIDNLLNNAIRFTKEGSITVTVEKSEKELVVKVSDTGIGIPHEKLKTIFEEFRQVSEGLSRNFEGTGLGLTIVKKCVKAIEGNIRVESELGKGSVFTITFPIEKILPGIEANKCDNHEITESTPMVHSMAREIYNVLLVEDEELNAIVVRKMMGKQFVVDHVSNAKDAIRCVKNKMYDVILMDINLKSEMSGIEAVKFIRNINDYGKIPIVAMTAYAMQKDKEEFLANGCSHFIAKPFTKENLSGLLYDILK